MSQKDVQGLYSLFRALSKKLCRLYFRFEARFNSHNELGIKGWTIKFRPWIIIHTEVYETKSEAMMREKWFKSGVGREYIKREIQK